MIKNQTTYNHESCLVDKEIVIFDLHNGYYQKQSAVI